ncbi:uncharacterized protein LOC8031154 [Ixodes scapularis]|uniref:uncharacterized protein LOC8031154 n=1 Tax=Ixodes scapularis TaxID=6945 RepID=UPI001A9DDD58|nr:uncharacterized protein LOC8031154 [Ixodes scapularis]
MNTINNQDPRPQEPRCKVCFCCFHLEDRASIQAFAALCFISNALVLLLLFFIVVNPEEATVFFKLNSIDTNVGQITAIPVPYVVTTTISIMVDLFLLIAIEDNCQPALRTFIRWSSFCTGFEVLSWVGLLAWKASRDNYSFFYVPTLLVLVAVAFKVSKVC